jgi:hypothetical protein
MQSFGKSYFVLYILVMTLIYHSCFFILDVFSFANFAFILMQIILSSLVSFGLILFLYLITFNRKNT